MSAKKFTAEDHTFAVCAYKESPYLESCLCSLEKQTCRSRIILCAAKTNDLLEKLAEKHRIPLYIRGGEPDIAADWNYACKMADSALVTLAHQDDIYEPAFLEKTLNSVNRSRHPLIAFTDYYELRGGKRCDPLKSRNLRIKKAMLLPFRVPFLAESRICRRMILSFGSPVCCPSVTYVKDHLPKRIFDPGYLTDLDWQAWERISRKKGSFCYIPDVLIGHRIHAGSTTTRGIEQGNERSKEDLEMFRRFWPENIAVFLNRLYSKAQTENRMEQQEGRTDPESI